MNASDVTETTKDLVQFLAPGHLIALESCAIVSALSKTSSSESESQNK